MASSFETEPPLPKPELGQNNPETEKKDRLKNRAVMAALAIGLTLAATFGTNEVSNNRPEALPTATTIELPSDQTLGLGAELNAFDIIPGERATVRLPGIELAAGIAAPDTTVEEFISPETNVQLMEWAQKFDVDPSAVEPRGPEAVADAVKQVEQLQTEGWNIDKITVQGFASDEGDDRKGNNPGFGLETNEKNIRLADTRAGAVSDLFIEQLVQSLGVDKATEIRDTIAQIGGEEVQDDEFEAKVKAMAEKLDMPMDDMVMEFNRDPESLPLDAQKLLSELYEDRFVRIEIQASREVAVPVEQKTKSMVIVPIFIPIPRRKRIPVVPSGSTPPQTIEPPRQQFPHAPRNIGNVNPGFGQVAGHNKDPNTHNGGHSKGSGGNFAAKVHTTHRGNQARQH